MLFVVHKDAPGLSVKGDWDPLGMRGTNSRDLILKDVFVTRDDLLEKIWGVNSLNATNALGMAINRLRRKVDAPFTLQLIHAVHGRGYTLDVRRGRQKAARTSSRTAAD